MNSFSYIFPAIRGIQAQKEYYTSMVPLSIIPKIFQFVDDELDPEIRSQRVLNQTRIPEIKNYIMSNADSYVFSSITVSVDGEIYFESIDDVNMNIGKLVIPMDSRFLINDGQHRCAAITEAIKDNPALKNEHISVVFFKDYGLAKSQQMFSDLNRYAMRPTKSINILYDSREESAVITKNVIELVDVFRGLTEKEKTSISNRSKALFTLSAISTATESLLKDINGDLDKKEEIAISFWSIASKYITEWTDVKEGIKKSSDIRKDSICSLSITLTAIGMAGNTLIKKYPDEWEDKLKPLRLIDWKKSNPVWETLVFLNGKVTANRSAHKSMSTYITNFLLEKAGE